MSDRRVIDSIGWNEDALAYARDWGLSKEDVEAVVRYPEQNTLDPHSHVVGHLVIRHRRGDVVVTTGYLEPRRPQILHVKIKTPTEPSGRGSRKVASGGDRIKLPSNGREQRRMLVKMGFKIVPGTRHDQVIDPHTGVRVTVLSTSQKGINYDKGDSWETILKYIRRNPESGLKENPDG